MVQLPVFLFHFALLASLPDFVQTNHSDGTSPVSSNVLTTNEAMHKIVETISTQSTKQEVTTTTPLSDLDSCFRYGSCEFVTKLLLPENRFCHCDEQCSFYDDCCVDSNKTKTLDIINDQFNCRPLSNTESRQSLGCFVITTCSDNHTNTETERKCNQDMSVSGPFVADDNGTIYKNRFCAECNGVLGSLYFTVHITSTKNQIVNDTYSSMSPSDYLAILLSDPDTQYSMIAPEGVQWRSCVHTIITQNITQDCNNYVINPLMKIGNRGEPNIIYRNQFCVLEELYRKRCFGDHLVRSQNQLFTYPLSVIFSFSSKSNGMCDTVNQIGDICLAEPAFQNTKLEFGFRLVSTEMMSLDFLDQVMLSLVFSTIAPDKMLFEKGSAFPFNDNSTRISHIVVLKIRLTETMSWSQVKSFKDRLKEFKWSSDVRILDSNNSIQLYTEKYEGSYELDTIASWRLGSANSPEKTIANRMDYINVKTNVTDRSIFCADIVVNSIMIGDIFVIQDIKCAEDIKLSYVTTNLRSIITYTGCSVSVVALLVSIVVSRKLEMPDSIPGNNLENLSIGLCLSNLIFMVGVGAHDYQLLCYVIGVVLHYLWLVSFSFMSIAVIYMCNNLTKMIARSSTGSDDAAKTKCLSTMLGLVLPVIFVLPSMSLDYFKVEMFSAEYDGLVCFPTGFLVNACFVSGPIILSVIVNIFCLVIIIINVTRHSKATLNLKKSQSFQQGKVYIRLCSFAGVFWVSGILGAFLKSEWIDFVFIVLCSLQGLAVAVANLTTRRVSVALKQWHNENTVTISDESF